MRKLQAVPGRSTAPRSWWATRRPARWTRSTGLYYFFKLIQRMRQILPPWMPSVGLEGGRINIVPVDFVVDALDTSPTRSPERPRLLPPGGPGGYRVGDVLDIFSKAAHAPR